MTVQAIQKTTPENRAAFVDRAGTADGKESLKRTMSLFLRVSRSKTASLFFWKCSRIATSVFVAGENRKTRFGKMINLAMRSAVVSAVSLSVLSACTTTNRAAGTGGLLSRSSATSTPYIASLQGGIIARSGLKFERNDLQRALEAEYKALEAAPGGQPVAWSGDDGKGQVVAAAPYQVGGQNCRQYTHTITADSRETKVRGTACRNADGSWTPLT